MGRLTLTSSIKKHESILKRNIDAGLRDYAVKKENNLYLAIHKKRVAKNNNLLEFKNGDFICVVGTCIYKGFFGQKALETIYSDFSKDVETLRDNAIGNYLVAIKKHEKVTIFVDKYQILKTYYFNINDEWLISNSLANVASEMNEKIINEFRLMEQVFAVATVEKETIYEGVFQLYGDEYLIIDLNSGKFDVQEIPYNRKRYDNRKRTLQDMVNEYSDMIRVRFATVAKVFGENIALHMTGGMDSRTVFSAFMNAGCKPVMLYGVGDSPITGTRTSDLIANRAYAKEFNLQSYVMNWKSNPLNDASSWNNAFLKYGFDYRIYGASRAMFSEYEGKIPKYPVFVESGYFGENLRLREWAAYRKTKDFTIDEFVSDYHLSLLKRIPKLYAKVDDIVEYLIKKFLEYARIYKIPNDNGVFKIDQMDELRWITARKSDSYWLNFCNEFTNSISMFSISDLHEFPFDVPAEYRRAGRFQLMLIDKLCPRVLKIPIFSHNRAQYYDIKTQTVAAKYPGHLPKNLEEEFEKVLKHIGFFKPIKKMYLSLNKECKHEKITGEDIKKSLIAFVFSNKDIRNINFLDIEGFETKDIITLMAYVQYLYGINLLKNTSNA